MQLSFVQTVRHPGFAAKETPLAHLKTTIRYDARQGHCPACAMVDENFINHTRFNSSPGKLR